MYMLRCLGRRQPTAKCCRGTAHQKQAGWGRCAWWKGGQQLQAATMKAWVEVRCSSRKVVGKDLQAGFPSRHAYAVAAHGVWCPLVL